MAEAADQHRHGLAQYLWETATIPARLWIGRRSNGAIIIEYGALAKLTD